MLESILEFRRGILFVRLQGILTKETIDKLDEVINLIQDDDVSNILLNMKGIDNIDMKGIHKLLYIYELCKSKKGQTLICGINSNIENKIKKNHLLNYIVETENELGAFDIIKI